MSRVLDVYLHNVRAGQLMQNDTGSLSFIYSVSYLDDNRPALSLSLPLREEIFEESVVNAYFSGLLPDDLVLHKLALYLGISEKNAFSLLEAIGGECAGALSLYAQGVRPPEAKGEDIQILDDQELPKILTLLKQRPLLAGDDGYRLSLAGAQDKVAIRLYDGKVALIRGTTPTTHILKPVNADIKDSVYNELFCMRLAKLVGIDTPYTEVRYANDTPFFLVERYDRALDKNGRTVRLHQEDFCQAMGIMPEIKYEREGGPAFMQCQGILHYNAAKPAADLIKLMERMIFYYLIGNSDAHGKNFSLLYKNRKPELAPAYDLLCTAVYPELSSKMAMKIGGKYKPGEVLLRHWQKLVPDTAAAKKNLEKQLVVMTRACREKAQILTEGLASDGISSGIFAEIIAVIDARAKHIEKYIS